MDSTVLHVTKQVKAPARTCAAAFRNARALRRWYDREANVTAFRVGGVVTASYYPSYEIVAIVTDQLVAQRYTAVVDGLGLWSFVERGKRTTIEFHHIADGNTGIEVPSRTFHWQGLLENLAALIEKRSLPFENGRYVGARPRGVRYETFQELLKAERS